MKIRQMLPSITTFALLALVGSVLAATTINTPASALSVKAQCRTVDIVAHRGSRRFTENTIAAYRDAVRLGARTIEADFRLTSDGKWVVMHDQTINKTTRSSGFVSRLSSDQLKRIPTNKGGAIPTPAAVLSFAKQYPSVRFQFEIKVPANRAQMQELLTTFASLRGRAMIVSFKTDPLTHTRAIDPYWKTGYITTGRVSPATVKRLGNTVLTNHKSINRAYVASMHRSDIRVYAWTTNTKKSWRKSVTSGVDGLVTDKTVAMRKYCNNARR